MDIMRVANVTWTNNGNYENGMLDFPGRERFDLDNLSSETFCSAPWGLGAGGMADIPGKDPLGEGAAARDELFTPWIITTNAQLMSLRVQW